MKLKRPFTTACVAAVLIAAYGCSKNPDSPKLPAKNPAELAVAGYADLLLSAHHDLLLKRSEPIQRVKEIRIVAVDFTVKKPTWLTKELRFEGDEETKENNLRITAAWHRLSCTTELVSIVEANNLHGVITSIVDERGKSHSATLCLSSNVKTKSLRDPTRINQP